MNARFGQGGGRDSQEQDPEKLLDLIRLRNNSAENQEQKKSNDDVTGHQSGLPLQSTYGNAAVAHTLIQRKGDDGPSESAGATSEAQPGTGEASLASNAAPTTATGLIVDDNVESPEPGQMRKTQFLSLLHGAVRNTAAEALEGSPWSAAASPYLDQWFSVYSAQSGQQIESAIRKYAPEANQVSSAGGLVVVVTGRVRQSVSAWLATGQMAGVSQGSPMGLPSAGIVGTAGAALSGAAPEIASAVSGAVSSIGNAASGIGNLFFKTRDSAVESGDPQAVQAKLGRGQPLDGGVQSRMESAFGESFGRVEVHTDAGAGALTSNLKARALTVGQHIAFSGGEYQPGTLIGDALIAHELAHVVQQRDAVAVAPAQKQATGYRTLEDDADEAAVGAVMSLWHGRPKGLTKIAKKALPGLKSGLRLQMNDCRCGKSAPRPVPIPPPKQNQTYEEWLSSFPGFEGTGTRDITSLAPDKLRQYITGELHVLPDCADVSLLLRHFYLESQGRTFTFKAGPEKKEFKIGAGVTDQEVGQCMNQLGTINFQEDRGGGFRLVNFYKQNGERSRNLKELLDAGLKPGDLLVWKRLPHLEGNFEGHVQTVQAIDRARGLITVVQGNMSSGVGVGTLQQRQYSFRDLTGDDAGNGDIKNAPEESFYGAGPWAG
jgi:hypothetical protein